MCNFWIIFLLCELIKELMSEDRWALTTWQDALKWCKDRNKENIRCTIDALGEDVNSNEQVINTVDNYIENAKTVRSKKIDASFALKLTALGANIDQKYCKQNLLKIYEEVNNKLSVGLEIDMEGTPFVDFTIETVLECANQKYPVTLALQAYLDRTMDDMNRAIENGIKVRLVKGAYFGNTEDFTEIQSRFRKLVEVLLESNVDFCIGTHDPELIEWVRGHCIENIDQIEFGLLKGLGDKTKLMLVNEGWKVSEYVPFGTEVEAYKFRRERYLKDLNDLGRLPAP